MTTQLRLTDLDPIEQKKARQNRVLGAGVVLLKSFALESAGTLLGDIASVVADAPFRNMKTPNGQQMSVAMTNCGGFGWITDKRGYRYSSVDPETKKPWPQMSTALRELAESAAKEGGFSSFSPDACLINRYEPGARMALHQDKDEKDFKQPIVSVSLGLPATFLFGGEKRTDKTERILLTHGDVIVWGGKSRLRFHGVLPVADGEHEGVGRYRINLTFRRAN